MGYWENTVYLNERNPRTVSDAVTALFADEGMRVIPNPGQRDRAWYEPMQYATALQNNLWGIAVLPGADGWTYLKTAPLEPFGERAAGASRMRLVELASLLGAPGFLFNVYDSGPALLVETDGKGRYLLSGYVHDGPNHPDPLEYFGEQLAEARLELRFEILPLQSVADASHFQGSHLTNDPTLAHRLAAHVDADEFAHRLAVTLGGPNARWCDNLTSVDLLICHKALPVPRAEILYFEWPARDRPEDELRARSEARRERLAATLNRPGGDPAD
jgi:hypothetical protein